MWPFADNDCKPQSILGQVPFLGFINLRVLEIGTQ